MEDLRTKLQRIGQILAATLGGAFAGVLAVLLFVACIDAGSSRSARKDPSHRGAMMLVTSLLLPPGVFCGIGIGIVIADPRGRASLMDPIPAPRVATHRDRRPAFRLDLCPTRVRRKDEGSSQEKR